MPYLPLSFLFEIPLEAVVDFQFEAAIDENTEQLEKEKKEATFQKGQGLLEDCHLKKP